MKKRVIWYLLPVITIVLGAFIYGCTEKEEDLKGTIYGTVTDLQTNEPIGGVNVKLKPTGEATLTGSDGSFEFKDLDARNYTLSFSKAEYADLDDDFIIELEAGKKVKRDVQMRRKIASLQITDMQGNEITELDFGLEESITTKSFNIFNNGSLNITCEITYSCAWITSVSNINNPITPGQTVTVTVAIDRSRLASGANSTILQIISNNGSNMLTVKATGIDYPTVSTTNVTNFTTSSATCGGNVTDNGGSFVTERGVCWGRSHAPTIENNNKMILGNGNGSFSGVISGLTLNTTYYVRAYAINNKGTAYGEEVTFTTLDGTPTVNTITPTKTGTTVTTGGHIVSDEGSPVMARGVCYGTTPYPDLSTAHNHTENGSGTGTYSSTFEMNSTGVYYVRAYATNGNGTSYGEQKTINHPYNDLPTFIFSGQTYRVAPPATTTMDWNAANNYCNNLVLYGYTDWRLPTIEELEQMYVNRDSIGGFGTSNYWSGTYSGSYGGSSQYWYIWFSNGSAYEGYTSGTYHVRPIRVEN
ncbi:MAG: DUF1566 domain-containing protein [Bacteroidales bacterium]|nr:DUF1566 domain-containing protein [Bacteroidales bacterium]